MLQCNTFNKITYRPRC